MELSRHLAPLLVRVVVVVMVVGVLVAAGGWSSPASAHTRTQETTNIDSRITSVPALDGVRWTVHTGGLLVEVENTSATPLIVHGYEGEPYLRVGPDGVQRNRRSPTTYLNDDRFARQLRRDIVARAPAMPADVDPTAPPDWVHLHDRPRAFWHDHRTHWMSPAPPAFVEVGPLARTMMALRLVGPVGRADDDAGVFLEWEVPFTVEGRTHVLAGEMAWVDAPAAWPWLAAATVLVLPGLVGLWRTGGARSRDGGGARSRHDERGASLRRDRRGQLLRPAAYLVAVVAATGVLSLVDDLFSWPESRLDELSGLLHTVTFLVAGWSAAAWAIVTGWGRRLALAIASGAVLYHQGLLHLPMLRASQFPTVWPDPVVRLSVALAITQAVVVAYVLLMSREPHHDLAAGQAPRQLPPHDSRATTDALVSR